MFHEGIFKKLKRWISPLFYKNKERVIIIDGVEQPEIVYLANFANTLRKNKEFNNAKHICERMINEYPDCIDGFQGYAEVFADEGNTTEAINYNLKAIRFIVENPGGFDELGITSLLDEIERLNNKESVSGKR